MKLQLTIVSALVIVVGIYANPLGIQNCANGRPPVWVDIWGCNATQCVITEFTWVRMTGQIEAPLPAKTLHFEVGSAVWKFRYAFRVPINEFDACQIIRGGCPLKKDKVYVFYVEGFIMKLPFLGTRKTIELILKNEKQEIISCGRFTFLFQKNPNVTATTPPPTTKTRDFKYIRLREF